MLRSKVGVEVAYRDDATNLNALRLQLIGRLVKLLIGVSVLTAWLTLPRNPLPVPMFALFVALLALGLVTHYLLRFKPALARHTLVWGTTAALVSGMYLFSPTWLPFVGSLLVFVAAVLVPGGEVVAGGAIFTTAVLLDHTGTRAYPLVEILLVLIISVIVAWLVVHTLYTSLQWAWSMQQRADQLLWMTRSHRADILRSRKSLEATNTMLQRTQRELAEARKRADEARILKEQFAANISHELRTPLNLILGFSEMMYISPEVYGDVQWPPTLRRDVYQIYRSSRHLLEMIDDILDLSRFEISGFTLHREPTQLAPLLHDTVRITSDLFRGSPVQLEIATASDLPEVEIDQTRIRQVLLNLLNNAHRFTQSGTVRLEARHSHSEVIISVADTGPGIPTEKLAHVFEEFYQVDGSPSRSHGGAGLGLAISKHFVEAHNGRIWAESQEGSGTTFYFTLPIAGRHAQYIQWRSGEGSALDRGLPRVHPRILMVDPDPSALTMARRHLSEYDILQVKDSSGLEEEVMEQRPRAIIYNTRPGEQPTSQHIASLSVPVIECSLPSQSWTLDNLRVDGSLIKPITPERILQEIDRRGDIRDVLIIDDDRGFIQLVERALQTDHNYIRLRRAYNGTDGLAAMRSHKPDLVLLDLVMPEQDGFEVLTTMRGDPALKGIPVILLTATSYAEGLLVQHGSQMVVHRQNGFSPAEILRCIGLMVDTLAPRFDEDSRQKAAM